MTDATLFVGGRVFTGHRYAEALLVEAGRVAAVGSETEVRRAAPTGADRRELAGALLLPGLVDAHLHVADLTRMREGLDLGTVGSIEELGAALTEWSGTHPGESILGRGWDPERTSDHRWPTRDDLDRAVADRPVFVQHVSGHVGVANSAALERAGVSRSTPDPPGGRWGRDAAGEPDGRAFETAVRALAGRADDLHLPSPEALARTGTWALSVGLTTIGAMSVAPEEAAALAELSRAGRFGLRVRAYLHESRWDERRPPPSTERFRVVGVKAFTDGAFGPRTAWLDAPYADDPTNSGMSVASDERLVALVDAAAAAGLGIALHAIGDRAVAQALRVLERGARVEGRRPRIEHAALTPPELHPALARVRPALVVQPGFLWSDRWLGARLGEGRARWAYAFRSLLDQGHLLAGSSDAPYDPADPWRGLAAAMDRQGPDGASANPVPEERLSPEVALGIYTAGAARSLGEPELGALAPGAPADLLVVAAPTLTGAVARGAASVRETWVGGRLASSRADQKNV